SSLEVLPGERGLSTLRIAADVVLDHAPPVNMGRRDVTLEIHDREFSGVSGWREMAGEDSDAAVVISGAAARQKDALTYALGLRAKPPRVDEGRFVFRARKGIDVAPPLRPAPLVVTDARLLRLALLVKEASTSSGFALAALALAWALGAAHALSPGHGKALAAAYLVGNRARPSQAILFGGAVTVAHTFVVFLMGCLAVTLEHTVGSDRLLRGLEVLSAAVVLLLGIAQLSSRWREAAACTAGDTHAHGRAFTSSPDRSGRVGPLLALGASAGLTPCPSALALLLGAIALRRYGFGLLLVVAFSCGVAVTLVVTGLIFVLARRFFDRARWAAPVVAWLPVASSVCVLALGILLCASAWSRVG
ncbi:MAG: sulfite exporter TauE/SafE family protein, partial [Polyangiaceae bacterium]